MLAIDTTSRPEIKPRRGEHATAIRMAELYVANARKGYETTKEDLEAEDFTNGDILNHNAAARRIANEALQSRDIATCAAEYDRTQRIEHAAHLVSQMVIDGEGAIFVALRQAGYPTRELGQLYPAIIDRTAQLVVEARAAAVLQVQ